MLDRGGVLQARLEEPTLVVVLDGILRINMREARIELGPCAMIYIPGGEMVAFEAPWSRVEAKLLRSYDLGPKPRILNHTYAVKSPEGEAALCLQVGEEGTRVLVHAQAYPVKGKVVAVTEEGVHPVDKGSVLRPPTVLKAVDAKKASILLITSK